MLTLKPDADGRYRKARLLTCGGVLGLTAATSPGSCLPTRASKITTIDTSGGEDRMSVQRTSPLGQPRWFGSGTLLPAGEVLVGGHAPISTLYLNKRRSRAASRRTTAVTRRVAKSLL